MPVQKAGRGRAAILAAVINARVLLAVAGKPVGVDNAPSLSRAAGVNYPDLSKEIFAYGPFALRWYGLAYLAGFISAWWLAKYRARSLAGWTDLGISDLIFYCALGVILGGRLGYVLFYGLDMAIADPLWVFKVWTGGMSFHGGVLGVIAAIFYFAHRNGKPVLEVADFVTPFVPVGQLFGRLANFVNTELPGRVTSVPWGLHYPCDVVRGLDASCVGLYENVARHPSPLYQAATEGVLLGVVMWLFIRRPRPMGTVSGLFLMGYGAARLFTEMFRQPDVQIGLIGGVSMGQLLSMPMVVGGLGLFVWALRFSRPPALKVLGITASAETAPVVQPRNKPKPARK